MNKKNIKAIMALIFLTIAIIIHSCYPKPNFSFIPEISYHSKKVITVEDRATLVKKDSVVLSIKFKDGDGDLGLNAGDTLPPFHTKESRINIFMDVFIKQGETFVPYPLPNPDVNYNGTFPRLNEEGKTNPLEGILTYKVDFSHNDFAPNTILKFKIKIRDRWAEEPLHFSNEIETDTVMIRRTP